MRRLTVMLLGLLLWPAAQAVDLGALWNYSQPAESERRFLAALATAQGDDALILHTQIARTHGLRRSFDRARAILATVEPKLGSASAEARVRYWLELGRTHASATHPPEALTPEHLAAARSAFMRAHDIAAQARLDGLAIDALHMMPFVDAEPEQQLAWNQKALAVMERSDQPGAKRWEASLRNNVGYALRLKGEHEAALVQFRLSRAAHERAGNTANVRMADWMIARTYRAQGQNAQALEIQHRLEREWAAAGEPDPYVWEELAHLYRATGDEAKARHYTARFKASGTPPSH